MGDRGRVTYRVFVVEDQIEERVIRAAFASDASAREGGPRLELAGLAQHEGDAIDQLEALEASQGGWPDAILLDDYLPDGRGDTTPRAIALMRWLCRRSVERELALADRPRAVLWSTCPPNVVYAFCALGGLQYVDKRSLNGTAVPVAAIWRALAGMRWRPVPYPDERHLPRAMREAAPYLEHGWSLKRTAQELGLPERALNELTARVKEMPRAPGPMSPDFPAKAAGAIRVMQEHGWVWIPYRLHAQLPAGMPFPLVIDPAGHREDLPPAGPVPAAYRSRDPG